MKNLFKLYSIVWTVLFLVFNVVGFIPSDNIGEFYRYNTAFFIFLILADLVLVLQLFLTYLSLKNFDKNSKKPFQHLEILFKDAAFLLAVIICGIIVQIFNVIPKWLNPILAVIIFALNYIIVAKNNNSLKNKIKKFLIVLNKRYVKFAIIPSLAVICILCTLIFAYFIPNSKYNNACIALENNELSNACSLFYSVRNFKDSNEKLNSIINSNPEFSLYNAKIGDTVEFGSYEQDGNTDNGKEKMKWTVLDIKNGKLLLINNFCIEKIPYNESLVKTTWEECTLRKWLNNEFLNTSFTDEETTKIDITHLTNHKNPSYRMPVGGKNTNDKVFVLSYNEANFYLKDDNLIHVKATKYAEKQSAHVSGDTGNAWWWLRTPGSANTSAMTNHISRKFSIMGYQVNHEAYTVRPCIWINL